MLFAWPAWHAFCIGLLPGCPRPIGIDLAYPNPVGPVLAYSTKHAIQLGMPIAYSKKHAI